MPREVGSWDYSIPYEEAKLRITLTLKENAKNFLEKGYKKYAKRVIYLSIYAIQLRNALRISEALDAFTRFVFTQFDENSFVPNPEETLVLVSKKKYVSFNPKTQKWNWKRLDYRKAIWPRFLDLKELYPEKNIIFYIFNKFPDLREELYRVFEAYTNYKLELERIVALKKKQLIGRPKIFLDYVKRLKMECLRLLGINTHTLRYSYITYLIRKGYNPSLIAKITHHSNLNYILTYTQRKQAEFILYNEE